MAGSNVAHPTGINDDDPSNPFCLVVQRTAVRSFGKKHNDKSETPSRSLQHVLDAAHSGVDWAVVAAHNGVNKRTAWGWINAARKRGDWTVLMTSSGGFRYRKLTEEHVKFITDSLTDNCNLTLRTMAELVDDEFHVQVSQETVRRALDCVCFMLKKTHRDSDNCASPFNKEKRHQYVVDLYSHFGLGKKVCYVDETKFNLWCARAYGWSREGERAVENYNTGKGKNIHLIACISEDGLEHSESRFG